MFASQNTNFTLFGARIESFYSFTWSLKPQQLIHILEMVFHSIAFLSFDLQLLKRKEHEKNETMKVVEAAAAAARVHRFHYDVQCVCAPHIGYMFE